MIKIVTRDQARQEIRAQKDCRERLEPSKNGLYCCKLCGSGHGKNGTGAVKYYPQTNTWYCFACSNEKLNGRQGDSIDLYMIDEGADYNTALQVLADELGLTIEKYTAADARRNFTARRHYGTPNPAGDETPPQDAPEAPGSRLSFIGTENPADDSKTVGTGAQTAEQAQAARDFINRCADQMTGSPAEVYTKGRGFSDDDIKEFCLGYDKSRKGVVIPYPGKDYYIVRRMYVEGEGKYYKPKADELGAEPLFIIGDPADGLLICEGQFDAIALYKAGAAAVAATGGAGGRKHLETLEGLKKAVIVSDNDDQGKRNTEAIKKILDARGVVCTNSRPPEDCKDINEALLKHGAARVAGFVNSCKEWFSEAPEPAADQEERKQTPPGLLIYEDIVNEFKNADDEIIDFPSFPEFTKTAKVKKHSTVAIAADTGGGKSSFAINLMNDLNDAHPCIYFNLEMDRLTLLRRLVAIQSGIELDRIEGYKNDEQTAAAVNVCIKNITSRQPLQVIQDVYRLKQIEDIIESATAGRSVPTMVFIDHSLLVELDERTAGRYERFTIISERLRKMALKYNIVLFVLLQQNRSGKSDDEEQPKNSSLKESGSWENDATQICFLWYDPVIKRKKLIITKNRGGDCGEFILEYWKKTQTYREDSGFVKTTPADDVPFDDPGQDGTKPVRTGISRR